VIDKKQPRYYFVIIQTEVNRCLPRLYASAVYAVIVCQFVCLSVRLSQTGILPKRLNIGSRKWRHTIAQKR